MFHAIFPLTDHNQGKRQCHDKLDGRERVEI